tara:strand:+ start:1242 stop:2819 length:1578 start_codon:yes stop_codon:yes gene_type:complete
MAYITQPINEVLTECKICCEKYNKTKNKIIICPKPDCSFDCCNSCFKTFIANNSSNPICMNCKTVISNQFIVNNVNKSFYNGPFKKQLSQNLFENELSKMPETMPFVQTRVKYNKEKVICDKNKNELKELKIRINDLKSKIYQSEFKMRRISNGDNPEAAEEKQTFIVPCRNENCKGFLNKKYKCEICNTHTCPNCLEFVGEKDSELYTNHECKKENIESAKLIRKDTKPCPKCGTRIYKIDGCDQMWCTECKVAFSWNKGTIETGSIHNPHYYQWLKNDNGTMDRNPLDVICGGLQDMRMITVSFRTFYKYITDVFMKNNKINDKCKISFHNILNKSLQSGMFQSMISSRYNADNYNSKRISTIHRSIHHIIEWTIPEMVRNIQSLQDNRELRIKYMLNEINDKKFKSMIMKNNTDLNSKQELILLFQLIRNFGIDWFNEYVQKFNEVNEYYKNISQFETNCSIEKITQKFIDLEHFWDNKIIEMKNLCKYFNEESKKISITYSRTVPVLYYSFDNIRYEKYKN